jgi:hypothetical protein
VGRVWGRRPGGDVDDVGLPGGRPITLPRPDRSGPSTPTSAQLLLGYPIIFNDEGGARHERPSGSIETIVENFHCQEGKRRKIDSRETRCR